MLLGVVLLYVGVVLIVNGIWLIGQARVTAVGAAGAEAAEAHPTFIQNREVSVLNLFTGFVGVVAAVTQMVQGNSQGDLGQIRGGGFILLFAFTYLWVAANNFLNAGGRAFGWSECRSGGGSRGHRDRVGVRDPAAREPDRLLGNRTLAPG
jgi:hypothetical protein